MVFMTTLIKQLSSINFDKTSINNPSEEDKQIQLNTFPPELFMKIFSYLNQIGRQSAVQVNSLWKPLVIDQVKTEQNLLVNKFINFIIENLDKQKYLKEINECKSILENHAILKSKDLLELKNSLLDIRNHLIYQLKHMELKELEDLKKKSFNQQAPIYFQELPGLASLYRTLDILRDGTMPNAKFFILREVIKIFLKNNESYEALKIADSLDFFNKSPVLESIASHFVEKGNLFKAIEVANAIPDSYSKFMMFNKIANTLSHEKLIKNFFSNDSLTKSIEVAKKIIYPSEKTHMLMGISNAFLINDNLDEANRILKIADEEAMKEAEERIDTTNRISSSRVKRKKCLIQ